MWIAPGDHTAQALRAAGARQRCRVAPWGARALATPAAFSDPIRPVSATVLAAGHDPGAVSDALEGLALASRKHEDLMVFLDAGAVSHSHAVWSRLRALGALERVSLLPQLEARRDPALAADLFIRPESPGEHRSVLLDALAAGMCVVTTEDPVVEALQHDQTCLTCTDPSALGWESAVLQALDEPQRARSLGARAQQWIAHHQPVSGQASALIDAYEDLTGDPQAASKAS